MKLKKFIRTNIIDPRPTPPTRNEGNLTRHLKTLFQSSEKLSFICLGGKRRGEGGGKGNV